MPEKEIIEFAEHVVKYVRDSAIRSCDVQLRGTNMYSPIAKRWDCAIKTGNPVTFGEILIPDVVDQVLFYFFEAIDSGALNLSYINSKGNSINLNEAGMGELAGEYAGNWQHTLSKERSHNYLDGININIQPED